MSRASYNSLADKYRIDADAIKNLALAQTLSEDIGRQKTEAARNRQLNITPPPARYQSAAEATADYAHANQLAIQTLESFMYPKDAANAFGDLLKNDQISEFNQYAGNFKKALGDQMISYIEFINYWQIFIEQLHENINSNLLYLPPDEKAEYIQNEAFNKTVTDKEDLLPLKRASKVINLPAPKINKATPVQTRQVNLNKTFASDAQIDKMKITNLKEYVTKTLNPSLNTLHTITNLKKYKGDTGLTELRQKVKETQKSTHTRTEMSRAKEHANIMSISHSELKPKVALTKLNKMAEKHSKANALKKIKANAVNPKRIIEINKRLKELKINRDYQQKLNEEIRIRTGDGTQLLNSIMTINNEINKLESELGTINNPTGKGLSSTRTTHTTRTTRTIHGRGLSQPNMIHRFKLLQGEVLAGNDNSEVINELQELITHLKSTGILVVI